MCIFGFEECSFHSNARVTGSSHMVGLMSYIIYIYQWSLEQDSIGDINNSELTETSEHMGTKCACLMHYDVSHH